MRFLLLIVTFSAILLTRVAVAQWQPDGVPVSTATDHASIPQPYPFVISDGAGGMIVAWHDYRSGTNFDIYAQRVDAFGFPQWTANGVALCTDVADQFGPDIVSDGSGGAIVTWADYRSGSGDIYAQRVNASGALQWTTDGVPLCVAVGNQVSPMIVSDGVGGAIVTWQDRRSGTDKAYARRVNASGALQWTADGVSLRSAASWQQEPTIVGDGTGGAIITWQDRLVGPHNDIYAQRVDASGALQWSADGIAVCTATYNQQYPKIVSDGSGGAIVVWGDQRSGTNYDIYARRVDATGTPLWGADGVALCTAMGDQDAGAFLLRPIISDGDGGAIVVWTDRRSGTNYDIHAQRVNAVGMVQWTPDGVAVCAAADDQSGHAITSDGAGGAIVSWHDNRNGFADIYAQRIDVSGAPQWTADGVVICAAASNQFLPKLAADGAGGAIASWADCRGDETIEETYHVYAQRVSAEGVIPTTLGDTPSPPAFALTPNFPNPFAGETTIDVALTADAGVRIEVFDVMGQRVRVIELGRVAAGTRRMSFDGFGDDGRVLPSGVYFYRVEAAGRTITRKMVIAR